MRNRVEMSMEDIEKIRCREEAAAILPESYLDELYSLLLASKGIFITPDMLDFNFPSNIVTPRRYSKMFSDEYASWQERADVQKISYVLLHDCDGAPFKSIKVLQKEEKLGIRSTLSVYATMGETGKRNPEIFPIDYEKLKYFQDQGFVISYHCNIATQPDFSPHKIWDMFNSDVDFLCSKGLDIRFYSPHGGPKSPEGKHNYEYFWAGHSRRRLISTHNPYAINGRYYSDGGLKASSDMRTFLQETLPGDRNLILLHPIYYGAKSEERAKKYFKTHGWIADYWQCVEKGNTADYWKETIKIFLKNSIQGQRKYVVH